MDKILERMEAIEQNMTDRISKRMEMNLQKGLERIKAVITSHDKPLSSLKEKITDLECSATFANNNIEEEKQLSHH